MYHTGIVEGPANGRVFLRWTEIMARARGGGGLFHSQGQIYLLSTLVLVVILSLSLNA